MKVLVVDDEPDVAKLIGLSFQMQQPDWLVLSAADGATALEVAEREKPTIILLDILMPDMSGFEVLQEIRRYSDVPVIILTARGEELDKITGLELGADDYITKPFSHLELLARLRAVLRRTQSGLGTGEPPFEAGEMRVDFARREVTVGDKRVSLSPTEYDLLYQLVHSADRVVSHEVLLARVWGREYTDEIDYLKVYIRRLRNKLEKDPHQPQYILTASGVGYWFRRPS